MVTSFEQFDDVRDRRATADVRLFVFYLSHGLVQVCEINRIHHCCSVGTGISKPDGTRGLPSIPFNSGPEGWDFFSGTTEQ